MQKKRIIEELKKRGFRITRQRLMLLDVILSGECSCCKEIYYKASATDSKIGTATVYRMVNVLEEIGAIKRGNMYKVEAYDKIDDEGGCRIELTDNAIVNLSGREWKKVVCEGLKICGYIGKQEVKSINIGV